METLLSSPLFWIVGPLAFVFVISGILGSVRPPKKVNQFYGYRTKLARSSQEHWDFAQSFSSKLMIAQGLYLILMSLIPLIQRLNNYLEVFLSIFLLLVSLYIIVSKTENELKKKFPN